MGWTVAVVSRDSELLREISWCLTAYGYQVEAHREFDALVSTWSAAQPDFLIVDSDHPHVATAGRLTHLGDGCFTYKILLHNLNHSLEIANLGESSFNDVISKPLNHGEVLARLRAADRYRQFERQLREESMCDHGSGLLSRSGLLQSLRFTGASGSDEQPKQVALVLMKIDFFTSLTTRFGKVVGDRLLCDVADIAADTAEELGWVARIGENVFAIAFIDRSLDEAESVAEEIREKVAAQNFEARGTPLKLTATLCVSMFDCSSKSPQELLRKAEKNLHAADVLGGSAVSRFGQFDEDFSAWVERNVKSGEALANLTARDVMTPFASELSLAEGGGVDLAELDRSGIELVPLLDQRQEYVGVLARDAIRDARQSDLEQLAQSLSEISENTSYGELLEHFGSEQGVLVVLRDRKPLGYVTQQSMATLLAPVGA